ncbi:sugar transferase [Bacillus cereus]|nr:sugar transferase [Bacillus cereus]MEB9570788.1 sugar transferase [Bacillus cereus]
MRKKFSQENKVSTPKKYMLVQRILDIVLSLISLVIASPLMLIIAFLIWLEDGGSAIFIQKRTGKDNSPFNIYKFRSMRVNDSDIHTKEFKKYQWENGVPDDFVFKNSEEVNPNVTKIGAFIRKSSLDELPQLFNVLKGDMSIVGPRPEIIAITEYYTSDQQQRLQVRPGITGWAQIHGRSDINNGEKLALDVFYVKNQCLLLDIYILLKTIKVVVTSKGAV